jgi:hypothetical protein
MVEAIQPGKRVTLRGGKSCDTRAFVLEVRGMDITPHVAPEHDQVQALGGRADRATWGL